MARLAMLRFVRASGIAILLGSPLPAETTVIVHPTGHALGVTPIRVAVPKFLAVGSHRALRSQSGGALIPAGIFQENQQSVLVAVLPAVPADRETVYTLVPGGMDVKGVAITKNAENFNPNISVTLGGEPFTTLVLTEPTKPYFHPLVGPTGKSFTRSFPMETIEGEDHDHNHQRSFWIAHGNANGFDFWGADPLNKPSSKYGRIQPSKVTTAEAGTAAARITLRDNWLGPEDKLVCSDERIFTFYSSDAPRILDVDFTIRATAGPVTFGDTKEGMLGLRVASSMDVRHKQGGKITNAEGVIDTDAWGQASAWVDYTGPVAGETVGIAILNHPESFRYPTTWHVRDYGLFAANPFGYHDFGRREPGAYTIPVGESIHFGYRILLHRDSTAATDVAAAFAAYAMPPRVEIHTR